MNKIKGWKAEKKLDSQLEEFKNVNKHFMNIKFIKILLRETKTLIMSLRKENKDLMIKLDEAIQNKDFWKHKSLEAEKQNKEMFKQHQEYFVENEKLKQELADCIMSNELLNRENDRLRDELQDCKNCIEMLENDNRELTKINLNFVKSYSDLKQELAEYEKFGLDKELERLKHTEGFGYE